MGYTRPSFKFKDQDISVGDTVYVVDPDMFVICKAVILVIRTRQFWVKVEGYKTADFKKDFHMYSKYLNRPVFDTPRRKPYTCALTMEDAAIELGTLLVQRGKKYGVKLKADKTHE